MKRSIELLAITLLPPLPFASVSAQGVADNEPLRCISLQRIDHTEVIDDSTIAFYLLGNDIYLNHLDRACFRLGKEKRFTYRTPTGRLCSADSISVLENVGFGLQAGASCGLGLFVPTSEEQIELLKSDEPQADVSVEEIEVEEAQGETSQGERSQQ